MDSDGARAETARRLFQSMRRSIGWPAHPRSERGAVVQRHRAHPPIDRADGVCLSDSSDLSHDRHCYNLTKNGVRFLSKVSLEAPQTIPWPLVERTPGEKAFALNDRIDMIYSIKNLMGILEMPCGCWSVIQKN